MIPMRSNRKYIIKTPEQYALMLALIDQWHTEEQLKQIIAPLGETNAMKVLKELKNFGWKFRSKDEPIDAGAPNSPIERSYRLQLCQRGWAQQELRRYLEERAKTA